MIIPPRLKNILILLLDAESPVSVDQLAQKLKASRRTIFRELENVEPVLRKTGVSLDSKIGKGILLAGSDQEKQALVRLLNTGNTHPQNRQDRQALLAFLMMDAEELQKLYYYANVLGVSEATVSLDMDVLESWFDTFSIELIRRHSYGAKLSGTEENMRRSMVALIAGLDDRQAFMKQLRLAMAASIGAVTTEGTNPPPLALIEELRPQINIQAIVM